MPETISITPPQFDPVVAYGIGGIAVVMAVVCVMVAARGNQRRLVRYAAATALWMGFGAFAATSGLLARFDLFPPPMMAMIASILAVSFALGLSPVGGRLAREVALVALVAIQSFRFPLELVMHHAAEREIMPVQLSYSGYNFDIATGIGAAVLAILLGLGVAVPRVFIWIWNAWGIYCLVAIVIIAVTTSPVVRAFGDDPANVNTWVLFFPYVWLPVVLVTIAIAGHIVVTRKLMMKEPVGAVEA